MSQQATLSITNERTCILGDDPTTGGQTSQRANNVKARDQRKSKTGTYTRNPGGNEPRELHHGGCTENLTNKGDFDVAKEITERHLKQRKKGITEANVAEYEQ